MVVMPSIVSVSTTTTAEPTTENLGGLFKTAANPTFTPELVATVLVLFFVAVAVSLVASGRRAAAKITAHDLTYSQDNDEEVFELSDLSGHNKPLIHND